MTDEETGERKNRVRAKRRGGLVVAVDGPAGAGKSTASRRLAERLGYRHVDTGALYRALGLLAWEQGVDPEDEEKLAALCEELQIEFEPGIQGVKVRGRDVTREIRLPEIGQMASKVSTHKAVRAKLLVLQRRLGEGGGVVIEGRDMGTVVFPNADVKFFLVASVQERGRRRFAELRAQGVETTLEATLREIAERDRRDSSRCHAPLKPAVDAYTLDTTALSVEEVVERMYQVVQRRLAQSCPGGAGEGS